MKHQQIIRVRAIQYFIPQEVSLSVNERAVSLLKGMGYLIVPLIVKRVKEEAEGYELLFTPHNLLNMAIVQQAGFKQINALIAENQGEVKDLVELSTLQFGWSNLET